MERYQIHPSAMSHHKSEVGKSDRNTQKKKGRGRSERYTHLILEIHLSVLPVSPESWKSQHRFEGVNPTWNYGFLTGKHMPVSFHVFSRCPIPRMKRKSSIWENSIWYFLNLWCSVFIRFERLAKHTHTLQKWKHHFSKAEQGPKADHFLNQISSAIWGWFPQSNARHPVIWRAHKSAVGP